MRQHNRAHLDFSLFPNTMYCHPPEPPRLAVIHLRLGSYRAAPQPVCDSAILSSSSPPPLHLRLSVTCPGSVKERFQCGRRLSEEQTHMEKCINTNRHVRTYPQTVLHNRTSSMRQWCDGQQWHLAGGLIRWQPRAAAKNRATPRKPGTERGRAYYNHSWTSVGFCGYQSSPLFAGLVVAGGTSERTTVNKQREEGWRETQRSAIFNIVGGVRLDKSVFV